MIRLSLIIATYNRSAALVEALRSVVRQDFPAAEWECIVVNNNSQDDTLARFEAFATEHPAINLRIVTEPGRGSPMPATGVSTKAGANTSPSSRRRTHQRTVHLFVRRPLRRLPRRCIGRRPYHTRISCGMPGLDVEYTERPIANPIDLGRKDPPFSERTYSRRRQHGTAAFDGPTIRRLRPFAGADRRATDRRRRERSFSAVGRRRRTLLLCSDSNYVAYHSAAKDLPGILRIIMLPGRTHPTPAGRNEGANRASVIGRSRQVGCDTPVGSRLPVAVLRPPKPAICS